MNSNNLPNIEIDQSLQFVISTYQSTSGRLKHVVPVGRIAVVIRDVDPFADNFPEVYLQGQTISIGNPKWLPFGKVRARVIELAAIPGRIAITVSQTIPGLSLSSDDQMDLKFYEDLKLFDPIRLLANFPNVQVDQINTKIVEIILRFSSDTIQFLTKTPGFLAVTEIDLIQSNFEKLLDEQLKDWGLRVTHTPSSIRNFPTGLTRLIRDTILGFQLFRTLPLQDRVRVIEGTGMEGDLDKIGTSEIIPFLINLATSKPEILSKIIRQAGEEYLPTAETMQTVLLGESPEAKVNKRIILNEMGQATRMPQFIVAEELPWIDSTRSRVTFQLSSKHHLTPQFLAAELIPYVRALAEVQYVLDDIANREPANVIVRFISQSSPISLSIEGIVKAFEVLREVIVRRRREHVSQMMLLEEKEKQAGIELIQAETLEAKARAAREFAEREKLFAEAQVQRAQSMKLLLEIDKERFAFNIESGRQTLAMTSPNLLESEKLGHIERLMPAIGTLTDSSIEPIVDPSMAPE